MNVEIYIIRIIPVIYFITTTQDRIETKKLQAKLMYDPKLWTKMHRDVVIEASNSIINDLIKLDDSKIEQKDHLADNLH